jgi:hypothetical protein
VFFIWVFASLAKNKGALNTPIENISNSWLALTKDLEYRNSFL